MKELKERIEREIEKKAMKEGTMGTETVSITMNLTDDEMKEFKKIDFNNHYGYDIQGNQVDINYTEDL
jgi:hypothetical protein